MVGGGARDPRPCANSGGGSGGSPANGDAVWCGDGIPRGGRDGKRLDAGTGRRIVAGAAGLWHGGGSGGGSGGGVMAPGAVCRRVGVPSRVGDGKRVGPGADLGSVARVRRLRHDGGSGSRSGGGSASARTRSEEP